MMVTSEVIDFAKRALEMLKTRCNHAIVDGGLNRVDVMRRKIGLLVVTEFESLEACYESTKDKETMKASNALRVYWLHKLMNLLNEKC